MTYAGTGTGRFIAINQKEVNVRQFGAKADGADDYSRIQAAVTVAKAKGAYVYFPAGTYVVKSTLDMTALGQTPFRGVGEFNSTLMWGADSPGTLLDVGSNGITIEHMQILGSDARVAVGPLWRAGDVGIASAGSVTMSHCKFRGFEYLIKLGGGFYHKFNNCEFAQAQNVIFASVANNLMFSQCRFLRLHDGIQFNGGAGPIVFSQCAIEKWYGTFVKSTAGAKAAVVFDGCYFENYPRDATVSPLPAGFYDSGFVCSGVSSLAVSGCSISLRGIRRFLQGSGATIENITSIGNRFNYGSGNAATCERIYHVSTLNSGQFNDYAMDLLVENGSFETDYLNGVIGNNNRVFGFDPITGDDINVNAATYATGTWKAFVSDAAGGGNNSPTIRNGTYTKIGRMVYCQFDALNNINTSGLTGGNVLYLSLPFAPSQISVGSVILDSVTHSSANRPLVSPRTVVGSAWCTLVFSGSGMEDVDMTVDAIQTGVSDIPAFTLAYQTNK